MSNVVDLRRRKLETIDEMVNEVHRQFDQALNSDKKAYSSRVYAGQLLNALKKRIEDGEEGENVDWWKWYDSKFIKTRRDARRVMKLAAADDPEAEAAQQRAVAKEGMRAAREKAKGTNVSPQPIGEGVDLVDHAFRLVAPLLAKMDEQQREQFLALITEVRYEEQKQTDGHDPFPSYGNQSRH